MKVFLFIAVAICMTDCCFGQAKADGILGQWVSGKKDTRIEIYKVGTKYFGKITWGTGPLVKDEHNPDTSLRKRDLLGLTILKDFEFEDDNWTGGTIYDPRNGKTYSCKMSLENNVTLDIRGYVGISLFGRTESWTRFK